MRTLTRGLTASAVAGALLLGSVASPAVMADGEESPGIVATVAAANPLAPQQADAAWWHFVVRKWGGVCGYVWLGGNQYEIKRWAYSWTSSRPACQRTGVTTAVYR